MAAARSICGRTSLRCWWRSCSVRWCVAAAVLAWRLNRGKVAAGLAIILLSLWLGALFYGLL
jgi:hypothetical protein